jgi:hypothetical protein
VDESPDLGRGVACRDQRLVAAYRATPRELCFEGLVSEFA